MLRFVLMLALLALSLPARADKLRVVATVPDLAALAQEVGGDHVKVTSLSLATQDPHFVDARPSLALEMSRADLLLLVGLDLEVGWLPSLLTGSRNAKIQKGAQGYLDASELVDLLEVPTTKVDRSMGDVHPGGNPHFLLDPRRALKVAKGIQERLCTLDHENCDAYQASMQHFEEHLETARTRWEKSASDLKGKPMVAYHKSFPYLADWLGFELVEHLEPKPGIPPSPSHVAKVVGTIKSRGVEVILQEDFYPANTAKLVAEKTGARLAVLHGGTSFHKDEDYIEHIDELVRTLVGS